MLTIVIATLFCLPHVFLKPLIEDFAEGRVAHRHIDQWNRIENSERVQHIYGQIFSRKVAKAIQWRKEFFSINSIETWGIHMGERGRTLTLTSHHTHKITQNGI